MSDIKSPYVAKCDECGRRRVIVAYHHGITYRAVCNPCDRYIVDRLNATFPTWPKAEYAKG